MSHFKKFDKALYEKNDSIAREAAKKFFEAQGVTAVDNPDKYGVDLLLDTGSCVEVEVKHTWKDEFKFDTLQIPARKEKFAKLGCVFMVFNSNITKAFIVHGAVVLDSPKKEVYNKYVAKGEMFFQVPVDKLILCEL
jgi:hypothetical protein